MSKPKRDRRQFVALHKRVIYGSQEWATFSPAAKDLYWLLKGKLNPTKREEIRLSYREVIKLKH